MHRTRIVFGIAAVVVVACGADWITPAPRLSKGGHGKPTPVPVPVDSVPTPTPPPPTDTTTGCAAYAYTRRVPVSSATQLQSALANVQSGDRIELADGTYSLAVRGTVNGTATLCGSHNAILTRGTVTTNGYAVWLTGSWSLDGFTVTNAQQGVRIESGPHCAFRHLVVFNIGQEAINPRKFSTGCVIESNTIHDTGKLTPEYGEGVYIGTYNGAWGSVTGGQPDRTDSVIVRNNQIGPNVTAEAIDVKDGMVRSQPWVDSWVELKRERLHRPQQSRDDLAHNVFSGNVADVEGPGYGLSGERGSGGGAVRQRGWPRLIASAPSAPSRAKTPHGSMRSSAARSRLSAWARRTRTSGSTVQRDRSSPTHPRRIPARCASASTPPALRSPLAPHRRQTRHERDTRRTDRRAAGVRGGHIPRHAVHEQPPLQLKRRRPRIAGSRNAQSRAPHRNPRHASRQRLAARRGARCIASANTRRRPIAPCSRWTSS